MEVIINVTLHPMYKSMYKLFVIREIKHFVIITVGPKWRKDRKAKH